MIGTEYVIEQLGQALKASHEVIDQQRQQIEHLTSALAATSPPPGTDANA